jgi:hypothetical protein
MHGVLKACLPWPLPQQIESVFAGSAVAHHMEPLYYEALSRGVQALIEGDAGVDGGTEGGRVEGEEKA